ncbi:Phage major capsid protein, P2 family [compost metagenome]
MSAVMLMEPQYREDTGLEAICGRELLHDKYFPVVNQDNKPSETLAAQTVVAQKRMGNLAANTQPFFPAASVFISRPDNLSIYWQTSGRRRLLKDNPEMDQVENYESSNDAYVIERIGGAVLVEKIEFGEWPAPVAP